MSKILILLAHPAMQSSTINKALADFAMSQSEVTVHDLYETYYDYNIDVRAEQALLAEHDIIIFQHPIYWYSCPALLKEWIDLVLEHNFAYGRLGTALKGKHLLSVVSSGGSQASYQNEEANSQTIRQFLLPFEQTAKFCGMNYLPPFVVFGANKVEEEHRLQQLVSDYELLLNALQQGSFQFEHATKCQLFLENKDLLLAGVTNNA